MNQHSHQKNRRKYRAEHKLNIAIAGLALVIFLLLIYLVVTIVTWIFQVKDTQNKTDEVQGMIQETEADTMKDSQIVTDSSETEYFENEYERILFTLQKFAQAHNFPVSEYPQEFIELLEKNPETEDFVCNYPLKKHTFSEDDMSDYLNKEEVPLFMQWDERWGYYEYGSSVMGVTGCGPTCLSMVAVHLLQNPSLTPIYMADYAERNGYYAEGIGTAWTFMSEAPSRMGLRAKEVPLDESCVLQYLQQGKPIICAMGPGDFTESGHFIVFIGIEDGKIKVNDPNSRERSEKLWSFEDIKYQIKNMWVYTVR